MINVKSRVIIIDAIFLDLNFLLRCSVKLWVAIVGSIATLIESKKGLYILYAPRRADAKSIIKTKFILFKRVLLFWRLQSKVFIAF